jgi:hypothetical protein
MGWRNFSKTAEKSSSSPCAAGVFDNSIIALPDACHFDGDLQPRWLIQSKNGNRHATLNQFQRGVTIAIFCFCCRGRLASKKQAFALYFCIFLSSNTLSLMPSPPCALSPPPDKEGLANHGIPGQLASPSFAGGDGGCLLGTPGRCASPSFAGGDGGCLLVAPGCCASPSFAGRDGGCLLGAPGRCVSPSFAEGG